MNQPSPYSSDGEQPLCKRTRADSSPAAGTNFHFVGETPADEARAADAPTPPPVAALAHSFDISSIPEMGRGA